MTDLPSGTFLVLALVGAGLAAWIVLAVLPRRQGGPPESEPQWRDAAFLIAGALWVGLLAYTLAAAFAGASRALAGSESIQLGLGTLLAALLGAPFLIWTTWLRHKAVGVQKDDHMTDRISKAVEQLGAEKTVKVRGKDGDGKDITIEETKPNLEVRIGAILSLERIAQDSTRHDKGRDHVRVMEILCAYVRQNAPAAGAQDPGVVAGGQDGPHDALLAWARRLARPRADVQIALDVIARRSETQKGVEAREPVRRRAENALWRGAQPGAWAGYRLDLRDTCLQGARLDRGDLRGARLDRARLEGANLGEALLAGARLHQARLDGAAINAADLSRTDLREASLNGLQAQGATLDFADLAQAGLAGGQWRAATFDNALLRQTDCDAEDFDPTAFARAFGDASVRLPDGITRPDHWPTWTLDPAAYQAEVFRWRADPLAYAPPAAPG